MRTKTALISILVLILALICCSQENEKSMDEQNISNTQSEEALFQSASKAEQASKFVDAVGYYDTIIKKYPDSPNRDKALFMAGYLKYEALKQNDEAIASFKELMTKYPESDLVDDAEFMMKAIGLGKDALATFEDENK